MIGAVGSKVMHGAGHGYGYVTRSLPDLIAVPAERVSGVRVRGVVNQADDGLFANSPNKVLDGTINAYLRDHKDEDLLQEPILIQADFGRTILHASEPYSQDSYTFALTDALADLLPGREIPGRDATRSGIHVRGVKVPVAASRRFAVLLKSLVDADAVAEYYADVTPGTLPTLDHAVSRLSTMPDTLSSLSGFPEYMQGEVEAALLAPEGLILVARRGPANGHMPTLLRQSAELYFQGVEVEQTLIHEEPQ